MRTSHQDSDYVILHLFVWGQIFVWCMLINRQMYVPLCITTPARGGGWRTDRSDNRAATKGSEKKGSPVAYSQLSNQMWYLVSIAYKLIELLWALCTLDRSCPEGNQVYMKRGQEPPDLCIVARGARTSLFGPGSRLPSVRPRNPDTVPCVTWKSSFLFANFDLRCTHKLLQYVYPKSLFFGIKHIITIYIC